MDTIQTTLLRAVPTPFEPAYTNHPGAKFYVCCMFSLSTCERFLSIPILNGGYLRKLFHAATTTCRAQWVARRGALPFGGGCRRTFALATLHPLVGAAAVGET